ncbi:MAG: ArsC family reductase [Gammaproteobacteria bacterium]|nr:MAG: ArsC family reductase [Gammaproteobacteria bacterium]RLA17230.1 MAG: ArsC family reductase [Gammaproteobacteria bacterium]
MILYGIPNCDTVAKARRWLDQAGIDYRFHNFRVDGITAEQISAWCDRVDWTTLLNRRSTSWRKVPADQQKSIDQQSAIALMVEMPTLIKRPVLDDDGLLEVGFKPERYTELLTK